MFFGEHALSPLRTEVAFDANNLSMSYSNIKVVSSILYDDIEGGISDIVIRYRRRNIDIEVGISDIV
jgi:hypothetical protein